MSSEGLEEGVHLRGRGPKGEEEENGELVSLHDVEQETSRTNPSMLLDVVIQPLDALLDEVREEDSFLRVMVLLELMDDHDRVRDKVGLVWSAAGNRLCQPMLRAAWGVDVVDLTALALVCCLENGAKDE